jgi:uncharacterized membrane protein (UPF0127 family)
MRWRIAIAAAVALASLFGMIAILVHHTSARQTRARLPFAVTKPALATFIGFDETRVALGSKCVRVLVAATPALRNRGLRDVRNLSPYDGMLFVFPADSDARFTMANTPLPLDITFFAGSGAPVDEQRMTPCPNGTDATCPQYEAKSRYRYALERPVGSSGSGGLGACRA